MEAVLKAPFPWFGGKSKVAPLVWERFGDVPNYAEPFYGSGAVLLGRPHAPGTETVNDLDCMVANFWRALQNDPDAVAYHADRPVNEADQHAIHLWLVTREEFRERMKTEIDYYDAEIAGRWVWGQCIWIGSGWCSVQLPHLGNAGKGLNRQLPHLGTAGTGLHRKRPHLGTAGTECLDTPLEAYMQALAARLRKVRVCCGDWSRVLTPAVTTSHGITGVFLDPPYTDGDMEYAAGGLRGELSGKVREWAIANGDNRDLRIALCGYEGEHEMPDSWEAVAWKARGGYAATGSKASENRHKETIWFSNHCLKPQATLF